MALIPACTVGDLLDSDRGEYATAKDLYDARGMRWNKSPRRMNVASEETRSAIIDLSARDVAPKDIAAQLGVDPKQVYYVRSQYGGAIDARRKELAGQNADGTPASDAAQPEAAFDKIMQIIDPEPTPEPVAQPVAAVHTHMLPQMQPEPDKPRMTIRSVEIKGAFADYCLMADHLELLGGGIDSVALDRLPALVADLTAIQAMATEGVTWRP